MTADALFASDPAGPVVEESPTPAGPPKTSSDVLGLLRRHYMPPGKPAAGIFAAEIGSPCGRRRADLVWLPTTASGGSGLVGHEIKVSRSDVLVELADPTKADPWARYCDRWWLVVSSPTLVDGLDIPEAWGVMAPPSGRRTRSMTVLRPAPKLSPLEPGPALRRVAAWQFYASQNRISNLEQEVEWRDRHLRDAEDRVRAAEAGSRRDSPHVLRLGKILDAVRERTRASRMWYDLDDDQVIEALADVALARDAAARLRGDVRGIVGHVNALTKSDAMARVAELVKAAEAMAAKLPGGAS
jgi:hypothetical protein